MEAVDENNLVEWLRTQYGIEQDLNELEVFGTSSTIVRSIDKLIKAVQTIHPNDEAQTKKLTELRKQFIDYPAEVLGVQEAQNLKDKYNWVPAPDLTAG